MFRLWGKIMKNNDMVDDKVFELDAFDLSTDVKVKEGLKSLCYDFDITVPMWLSDNTTGIKMVGKTKFMDHHFIESIKFDYLEIEIIENDEY